MEQPNLPSQDFDEKINQKEFAIQTSTTEPQFQPRDATDEEIEEYPHITDKVPFSAWIVILAGAAERATYFGIIAPWRKFYSSCRIIKI
jgi:POT family proton-dependent oligopeptide transporter